MYKEYKSGGSVITERLYIDIKQDFKKKKKNVKDTTVTPAMLIVSDQSTLGIG